MNELVAFFQGFHPIVQALIAGCFTWLMTALGAAFVFTTKELNKKMFDLMLGFAAGVMISASFFGLLLPAIEMVDESQIAVWIPASLGFLIGCAFLFSIDKILPHIHHGFAHDEVEGVKTSWKRTTLLILAVTLHNIPEGIAIGVAFGAAAFGVPSATLAAAIALAIGIGIQDFPEGLAVSMPLRREGMSRIKSFWYGQLSGIVEPIGAIIGASAVMFAHGILPYALGFAAGAMIFVVVEEVIPESQTGGNRDLATIGTVVGFVLMMVLDVALGH